MAKYKKKPVVIEAVQWDGNNFNETPAWLPDITRDVTDIKYPGHPTVGAIFKDGDDLWVGTLEGNMVARPNSYIIQGVQGEIYPCKFDIFEATYEKVSDV